SPPMCQARSGPSGRSTPAMCTSTGPAVAGRPHALRGTEGERHRQGGPPLGGGRDDRRQDRDPARQALVKKEGPTMTSQTVRLTVAQAVVTYLSRQYSVADGERRRLIPATLGIFGHGNVAGMGQALDQLSDQMPFVQGRNEQPLAHLAIGYAKAVRRHATLAVTASIGPGA